MTSTFTRTPRRINETRRNRARNPRFGNVSMELWSVRNVLTPPFGVLGVVTTGLPGTLPTGTTYALRCVPNNSASTKSGAYTEFDVVDGEQITASTYLRPSAARNTGVDLEWLDENGAVISTSAGAAAAHAANAWERRSVTATAPAGTQRGRLFGHQAGGDAAATLQVTAALVEEAAALAGFFDGDTADADPTYYGWDGAESASESTMGTTEPTDVITPDVVHGYEAAREIRTVVHPRLGTGQVSVSLIEAGPRAGVLELVFPDPIEAATALAVFGQEALFTFADTEATELDMLFAVAGGRGLGTRLNETRELTILSVPFVEVVP